jgi:folate-binding protein YgfZ
MSSAHEDRLLALAPALSPLSVLLPEGAPFPVLEGVGLSARALDTVALHPRVDLDLIRVSGPDRGRFLQGLLTADILKLPIGQGAAAALLDVKGKMQCDMRLYQRAEDLLIELPFGMAPAIVTLLDRYLIRMKAKLHDDSARWAAALIAGPLAEDILRAAVNPAASPDFAPPADLLSGVEAHIGGCPVSVTRTDWLGRADDAPAAFHVWSVVEGWPQVWRALCAATAQHGGGVLPTSAFEAARIQGAVPRFGVDIDTDTIPLEADLLHLISFTKGCYLGQEIIARVDARGAVARRLVRVRVRASTSPAPGAPVTSPTDPSKVLGRLTSVAALPDDLLAFAWTRRGFDAPGTHLSIDGLPAEVL